ncbi:MAG: M24 family metallopeptidase [Syntrophales bacterium]
MKPQDRINNLQKKLGEQDLAGALIFYSRDVFYYTGTAQPSYLLILPDDYRLFVRSGYDFALSDIFVDKENVEEERRLDNIFKKIFNDFDKGTRRIGTELDVLTVEQLGSFKKAFRDYDFVNISPVILEQRKTKDPSEVERIRKACEVIHRGHEAVLVALKDGITELELAAAVENSHRLAGHEGIFFIRQPDFFMSRGPISSGENLFKTSGVVYTITGVGLSPSVPAGPSRRRLCKGDLVMVDIPVIVEGYHADQTRTYCLGRANENAKSMYSDLRAIADHLISNMKGGMKCSDIYKMAVEKASALGREGQFQSFGGGKRSRLIGHGIGLELNEPPVPSEYDQSPVEDGYVIALDMHMLDESVGVVKLEDMILIKEKGNEILTTSDRYLFEV